MAKLSTYVKDTSISGEDLLVGSNYIGVDNYATNNFKIKDLSDYFAGQINIDPGNLPLKANGGIVYETVLGTDFLAIDLSATNITGQLANSDLANSYITINGSDIELGGSIDIPIGDITSVIAGTYLNGGGTINDVTINHDNTSRSDTTSSPSQLAYDGTFTAITSVSTNATGHLTAINTATYTLPSSDETNDYVDSITVTGTTTKTITLGRTGALSDLTANFTDNDTIPNDATITLSAGTYISGGGDFTTDQSSAETITFNHDATTRTNTTSSVTATHEGTVTAIDSITTNSTGHITEVNTKTITFPAGAVPNDGLLDINQGTDISLTITGGDFTADKSTETDIIINHANITRSADTTSSVGPNHGGTFTAIDSITSSATGHITVANLKTVTLPNGANDNTITVSAGTYLSGGGDFTVDQSFDEIITINHDSTTRSDTTSTASPAHGANFTAIDSVTTNATGHITAVNTKTITLPSDNNTDILQRISADSTNAERYVTFVNSATGDLEAGSDATFRFNPSTNKLTVANLEVTGTQTINNVEVINTSGGIVFEGSVDDDYETTFNVINPTADRAINLPNKSGTVALLDDIPTVNDGTLTVQGSSGLTGSGTFTANDADSPTITISHADTSSQASVNNANNDFIQDITLDDYGHITGIVSGTATNTITEIREDTGSYRTGSITLQSGTNVNITEPSTGVFNFASTNTTYSNGPGLDLNGTVFSHTDTSSQSSVNNSGRTYIQDITLDTYGHVTGLTSATETVTDTNTTYDLAVPSGTTYVRLSGSDGTTDDILITGSGSTTVTRVSGSALQISSTDTNTIPNNGLLDINQGTDISLAITGGDFTADKSTETDIVINHANIGRTNTTSTAAPAHGATFTAVDSITTSSTGHVTAVNTKTVTIPNESNPTVNNGTLTINTAGIASGSGTFTANQAGNSTITITATEADTLATVTGRGASTTTQLFFDGGFDSHPIMLSGAQNFDNIDRSGFYNLYNTSSGSTNSPPLTYGTMIAIGNDKGSLGFGLQIAHERTNAGMYVRGMNDSGSTWSSWAEIWTSLTDGSGSGLDADMLDGLHASSFLTSESDTLATVTARGNTTSATISVNQVIATNNGNGTNYRVGDDAWIGDTNIANTFRISGVQDSTKGYITFGSSSNAQLGRSGTGALTWDSNTIWHAGNDGPGTGLNADLLDSMQPTDAATGSTVVSRNSSGDFSGRYIFATNFNQSAGIENPTINSFWTSNSSDGYARKSNVAHVRSAILNDTLATVTARGNVTSTTVDLRSSTPLLFTSNGNTATYTQTAIYANQNNTSGSYANGIFIERGKLSNSNSAEIRHLVIGSRGGQRQFVFTEDKLGIGVDAPDYALHTLGSGHERLKIESTGNNTAGVYMQVKSSGSQVGTGTVRVDNSGNMNFFVGSSNELERFRIYGPTGQVSVGISTVPSNIKFQSDGDIRINSTTGSLWIGGYNDSQAGRVRLHSSNGGGYLDWEAATGTSNFVFRYDTSNRFEMSSGGTFTASADIVAYGSPSDITLKENIKPIENALDKVEKLQGVTFDWKESDSILDIKEDIGFIAQDVQKVLPELVRENENGKLSLRHQGIVPILLEAIKELSDKVKALENGSTK